MAKNVNVNIKGKETVSPAVRDAQKALGKLGVSAQGYSTSMARSMAIAAGAVAAVGLAVSRVGRVVDQTVQAWAKQEQAVYSLQRAIANNPMMNGAALGNLQRFASQLQQVTTIGDEATLQFSSMLSSLGLTEEQIRKTITAAANLSAGLGISMESAVRNLAKTYSGLQGELGEMIPQLRGLTQEELKAGGAIDLVERQFAGMAETLHETTTGSMAAFRNAWGDLMEQIGRSNERTMKPLRAMLQGLVEDLTDSAKAINDLQDAMTRFNAGQALSREELQTLAGSLAERARHGGYVGGPQGAAAMREAQAQLDRVNAALEYLGGVSQTMAAKIGGMTQLRETTERQMADAIAQAAADREKAEKDLVDRVTKAYKDQWDRVKDIGKELDLERIARNMSPLEREMWEIQQKMESISDAWGRGSEYEEERLRVLAMLQEKYDALFAELTRSPIYQPQTGSGWLASVHDAIASSLPGGAASGGGPLDSVLSALGDFASGLVGAVSALSSVQAVIQPLVTVIGAAMDILGPVIDDVLAPLVGIFRVLGQFVGHVLTPIFQKLAPAIEFLAQIFTWLYNNVLRPVGNAIIVVGNLMYNAMAALWNGVAAVVNFLLGWLGVNLKTMAYRSLTQGVLQEITTEDVRAAGTPPPENDLGSKTTVQRAPDIYIYQTFEGPIMGAGGMEEFGKLTADALQRHAGIGGRIHIQEAIAPVNG